MVNNAPTPTMANLSWHNTAFVATRQPLQSGPRCLNRLDSTRARGRKEVASLSSPCTAQIPHMSMDTCSNYAMPNLSPRPSQKLHKQNKRGCMRRLEPHNCTRLSVNLSVHLLPDSPASDLASTVLALDGNSQIILLSMSDGRRHNLVRTCERFLT